MKRMRLFLFALLACLFLSQCASNEPKDREEVSAMPWNRPQRWEGQGALGGMMSTQGN